MTTFSPFLASTATTMEDASSYPGNVTRTCPPANLPPEHYRIYMTDLYCLGIEFVLALIGNLCTLEGIRGQQGKRSRMHLFILHLAVADLIVAFFMIFPEWLIRMVCGFHAGDFLCKLFKYGQIVGMFGSTFVMLAAAFDRYKAIKEPLQTFKMSEARVHGSVTVAWLLAFILAIPQAIIFQKNNGRYCEIVGVSETFIRVYTIWYFMSVLIVPTCLLMYFYGMIALIIMRNIFNKNRAEKRDKTTEENGSPLMNPKENKKSTNFAPRASSTAGIAKARMKTVQMTFVIVLAYFICYFPFFIVQLVQAWNPKKEVNYPAIYLLACLNSCVNPWIYMCFSGSLFSNLKRTIFCKKKKTSAFKSRNDTSRSSNRLTRSHVVTETTHQTAISSAMDSPSNNSKNQESFSKSE